MPNIGRVPTRLRTTFKASGFDLAQSCNVKQADPDCLIFFLSVNT